MIHDQIASSLEQAFSQHGFAEPSVAKLKIAAGVSLRTLYCTPVSAPHSLDEERCAQWVHVNECLSCLSQ